MRKYMLAAGVAAITLIPTLAAAQVTCEQRSANRAAGTAVGAVAGALLGSAVAGHHDRGTGAVVGGVTGAVVGNQLSRGPRDCAHAYGWYDNDGRWHGQRVDEAYASGYYDRNGTWIDGRPAGHWDRDRGMYIADAGSYGANANYVTHENALSVNDRIDRMYAWIDRAHANGRLSGRDARQAHAELQDVRREARWRMRDGVLSGRDEQALQAHLDRVASNIRYDTNSDRY